MDIAGDKNVPSISSPVQLSCHKAILCARSPFFRNLVSRRLIAQQSEKQDRGLTIPQPLKIVLDETVIPQKYSRVLVRALYVDSIDFDLVDDKQVEIGDRVRDAMELYQIGRFLDLDILSQNCEDAIVQRLNQDNIADVLEWSSQPYGSPWVNRQANQFLLEDFAHIAQSPALDKVTKDTLRSVLTSDFVQASEAEILGAIIRWGEMTVTKRGEALTGEHVTTTHSSEIHNSCHCVTVNTLCDNLGRRGIRRREGVHDKEVAEAVCDLVGCVRLEHVLPLGGEEAVRQAATRGILTRSWVPGGFGQNTARGQEYGTQHWDPRIFRCVTSY